MRKSRKVKRVANVYLCVCMCVNISEYIRNVYVSVCMEGSLKRALGNALDLQIKLRKSFAVWNTLSIPV